MTVPRFGKISTTVAIVSLVSFAVVGTAAFTFGRSRRATVPAPVQPSAIDAAKAPVSMGRKRNSRGLKVPFLGKLSAVAASLSLMAAVVAGTLAVFTATHPVASNAFTTGTVDLTTAPASALFTVNNMAPGDLSTQSLVVTNTGSLALRYAITASATNSDGKALKDQLVLTIKTIDVTTPGTPCDNFDGTQLYTGDVDGTTGALVGDITQGAQAGDRALASSTSETLCFRVQLPLSTGNSYQGATTAATFTFNAEQTANN